ncbi:YqaA family protein [Kordiimonas marina]|uniref:YqaA family protein n=1 Tax=Kordiimonas marina TaxID=2872312 RepID=UPI001FF174BD|nr:YqaA family protein [Kordiimonas marina]MCJ9428430.1 DedA family protein [Kordiimonas marina]
MIRRLYDWTMTKVSSPKGERWLMGLAFAEASFFPIPPDILMIPMILADRKRAWRLATLALIGSVIGAVFGYLIGAFLYEAVAQPIIAFYGLETQFDTFKSYYADYGILIILIAGFTPIPFKVFTIASGVAGLNPVLFFLTCIPARASRFYLVAGLLWRYGEPIRSFIEKRLGLVISLVVAGIIGGFVALKYIG